MSVKGEVKVWVMLAVLTGTNGVARADVFGLGHAVGKGIGEGAVEKLDPVLAHTLASTDTLLAKHEDRIGNLIGTTIGEASTQTKLRLDQVDGILEKRLLQVQLGVDQVLDHGLAQIDGVARVNIARIDDVMAKRIGQVERGVTKALHQVDDILDRRIAQVGDTVTVAIDQANGVLTARLDQVDEIAGRRLGNVDVIVSKQRLGIEQGVTRAAWLLGLIAFVVIILHALWKEYLRHDLRYMSSKAERVRRTIALLSGPFFRHAMVGVVAAALLAIVPQHLPQAAQKQQQALVDQHAAQLKKSLAALDWTRVRFHASQLELLMPDDADRFQAMAAKADLLRDVLEKPTAFASSTGIVATMNKIEALERLQGSRRDPDARTVRAMVLWAQGKSKADELHAATLAAKALWSAPGGFTLAPMARLMVEAYLHAPQPLGLPAPKPDNSKETSESIVGLQAALELKMVLPPGSPFEGLATLFRLMRQLDDVSGAAYVAMVEEQAAISRHPKDARARAEARRERNRNATTIVEAWAAFDRALLSNPVLAASPSVLGIFRLDDVQLTHALWYTTQPEIEGWPVALASLDSSKPQNRRLLLAIAPARAVWARRYLGLLQGPARELVELQEARRFEVLEQEALSFEASYGEISPDLPRAAAGAPSRPHVAPSPERLATQVEAVTAATALGLYVGTDNERQSLAEKLTSQLQELKQTVDQALQKERTSIDGVLAKRRDKMIADLKKRRGAASNALHRGAGDLLDRLRENVTGRPAQLF